MHAVFVICKRQDIFLNCFEWTTNLEFKEFFLYMAFVNFFLCVWAFLICLIIWIFHWFLEILKFIIQRSCGCDMIMRLVLTIIKVNEWFPYELIYVLLNFLRTIVLAYCSVNFLKRCYPRKPVQVRLNMPHCLICYLIYVWFLNLEVTRYIHSDVLN